jgi:hypothetical protein
VIVGREVHAGVAAVWFEPPWWVRVDDAVTLFRKRVLLGAEFRLTGRTLSSLFLSRASLDCSYCSLLGALDQRLLFGLWQRGLLLPSG